MSTELFRWGGQSWIPVTARKAATCDASGEKIKPGDKIWRPLGNGRNRFRRLKVQPEDSEELK
jgi:hypothetical protein